MSFDRTYNCMECKKNGDESNHPSKNAVEEHIEGEHPGLNPMTSYSIEVSFQ